MKIYVGNLTQETAQPQLREAFTPFGEVSRVTLAIGTADGKRMGFGFVEMPSDEQGMAAITGLDGHDLDGNVLKVHIAHPRTYRANPSPQARQMNQESLQLGLEDPLPRRERTEPKQEDTQF